MGDKYFAYCITYTSGPLDIEEIFLIIGLCVGLGGIMLLLITVIVCVVITKRRRRNKQPASGSTIYPPDWRPLPGQVPLHSYGDASKSNNYLNDYVISGYENNIQSDSTANAAGALYPCGIDATEASSQPSNRRALNAKPFGYIVRPGKRISWTRPTKEESMREPSQRQSKDKERYLHGLPKFALGWPSSNDLAHNNTSDYTNMQNVPSGSRNILQEINEAVELDDTEYNRYTSETNNRTEIKRRNLPSYYPPINDSKDDGLRRQPGRSEYPTTTNQKSTEEM